MKRKKRRVKKKRMEEAQTRQMPQTARGYGPSRGRSAAAEERRFGAHLLSRQPDRTLPAKKRSLPTSIIKKVPAVPEDCEVMPPSGLQDPAGSGVENSASDRISGASQIPERDEGLVDVLEQHIPTQFTWGDMRVMSSLNELSLFKPFKWHDRLKDLREDGLVRLRWETLCFNGTDYHVPLPAPNPHVIGDEAGLKPGELEALGAFRDYVYREGYQVLEAEPEHGLPKGVFIPPGEDSPDFSKGKAGRLVTEMLEARKSNATTGGEIVIKGNWEAEVNPEEVFHNPSDDLIMNKFQDWRMSVRFKRGRDFTSISEVISYDDILRQKWKRKEGRIESMVLILKPDCIFAIKRDWEKLKGVRALVANKLVKISFNPPKETHSSFVCALKGPPALKKVVPKHIVKALRNELKERIFAVVLDMLHYLEDEAATSAKKALLEKGLEMTEKREEAIKNASGRVAWGSHRKIQADISAFVREIFPETCVKSMHQYRDEAGQESHKIVFQEICPDLIFAIQDRQRRTYWEMIRERAENLPEAHDLWEDFFTKIKKAEIFDKDEDLRNRAETEDRDGFGLGRIFGNLIMVERSLGYFAPHTERYERKMEEEPVVCSFCYKMNHFRRNCRDRIRAAKMLRRKELEEKKKKKKGKEKKKGRKGKGKGKREVEKEKGGSPQAPKPACTMCGKFGHHQSRCTNEKWCVRCREKTHGSHPRSLECPILAQQRAYNKRKLFLSELLGVNANRRDICIYANWVNKIIEGVDIELRNEEEEEMKEEEEERKEEEEEEKIEGRNKKKRKRKEIARDTGSEDSGAPKEAEKKKKGNEEEEEEIIFLDFPDVEREEEAAKEIEKNKINFLNKNLEDRDLPIPDI